MKKVCYLLERFPAISTTFIINEINGLIEAGCDVSIISLDKSKHDVKHKGFLESKLNDKTIYIPFDKNDEGKELYRSDVFENGTSDLFESNILNIDEKERLLRLCYDQKYGREIAFKRFSGLLKILKVIKNRNIEHIHMHFGSDAVELAWILNKFMGIDYSFTMHGSDIFICPHEFIKKWADCAEGVITVSKYNKKYLIDKFGIEKDKIKVIPCGIDLDIFKPVSLEKEKKFTILNIGRLHPVKGQKYLVEACRILKDKDIDFQCWVIGEGEENLKNQISELGLDGHVKLLGSKNNEELIEYYNKADVFVLPSLSEGSPVVIKEALACGTPVIASDVRGIYELVSDNVNGFLVEPKKPEILSKKITELIKNKELLDKFKNNSRNVIEERFDFKKNIHKIYDFFEE